MHFLPAGAAVHGRCTSCGLDVAKCRCAFSFELLDAMANSAGITVGVSAPSGAQR
jgi:hypothetical protein